LLALLEDSDDRIYAFGKSQKKNLRSMPSCDPLLSDRTEDKDMDMAMAVAMVVEDSLQKNTNAILLRSKALRCDVHGESGDADGHKGLAPLMISVVP